MEPTLQIPSLLSTESLNSMSPKSLRKKLQQNITTINKIAEEELYSSSSGVQLIAYMMTVHCYQEVKQINNILTTNVRARPQRNSLAKVEKTVIEIIGKVHESLVSQKNDEKDLIALNEYDCEQIEEIIGKQCFKIFENIKVKTEYLPNFLIEEDREIQAIKITLERINQDYLDEILSYFLSLVKVSELLRDDLEVISDLLSILQHSHDLALNNISITLSQNGKHCSIQLGHLLIITNSDILSPGKRLKYCYVQSESIEDILNKKDSDSKSIPILRGIDSMGINVARYLGLAE